MDKLHEIIEKLEECMYAQLSQGIENVDTEEMYKVADIYKDLVEAEYHCTITKAMKENSEDYGKTWNEKGKFYTRVRDSKGHYMKGYEEPMMYDERMEDYKHGKMYYSEPSHNTSNSMNRASESSYDKTRRMYTETKAMTPHDKAERLAKFNKHLDAVEDDFMDLKDELSPEERATAKQKFVNISNKM